MEPDGTGGMISSGVLSSIGSVIHRMRTSTLPDKVSPSPAPGTKRYAFRARRKGPVPLTDSSLPACLQLFSASFTRLSGVPYVFDCLHQSHTLIHCSNSEAGQENHNLLARIVSSHHRLAGPKPISRRLDRNSVRKTAPGYSSIPVLGTRPGINSAPVTMPVSAVCISRCMLVPIRLCKASLTF